ncbi:MAG: MBL fold metallo-hydrolase [bacterium]
MTRPLLGFALSLAVGLAACSSCCCGRTPKGTPRPVVDARAIRELQKRTHVVLLGTGTPNADPARHGPSLAVVAGGRPFLVDCGPGVVRRAAGAHRRGVKALKSPMLGTVFLTHLHSDHTAGAPDLVLAPWVLGRKVPLQAFGPPGTAALFRHLTAAYQQDVQTRLRGLEPAHPEGHKVTAVDKPPGVVYRDADVTVTAFPATHGAWKHAYGYRFATRDLHVCVSGDTRPYDAMVSHYRGCDILIHEVYSTTGFRRRPPRWQRYHRASHTSSHELGDIARQVRPALLVLYHQLFWGSSERELLAELRTKYRGPVVSGRDLMLIGVSADFARGRNGHPHKGSIRAVRLAP